MKRRKFLIFFFLGGAPWTACAQNYPPLPANSSVTLSETQWPAVLSQFEDSVLSASQWLQIKKAEEAKLQLAINGLEEKVAGLRKQERGNPNVINEFRLKGLLNELRDKLEQNSSLQRQWEENEKDFEQKALSLTALYNDRIQVELESSSEDAKSLDSKLTRLALLVQKRNQTESLLKQYQKKDSGGALPPVTAFETFQTGDRESLQLTLDLFHDRHKELEERLEKLGLEQEEVKNELKLQGKMQEFVQDIQRLNEDSNFPRTSLKRDDLEEMVGKNQKSKLDSRLQELQMESDRDQKTLAQLDQLIDRVRRRLDSLKAGDRE